MKKRIFDIIVSFLGILIISPFAVIIALRIKLNDKGPVFFRQERIGKDGGQFMLYKFRSMTVLASAVKGSFEPGNISRVTSVGKFLRKTKMDELPQLINVLKGEMSLVGPRPEVKKWIQVYPERWRRVLSVKPGITDNASIEFRDEEALLAASKDPERTYEEIVLPKKLDLYEDYVVNHTFWGDIKIISRTLIHIFKKTN
jgi:lipopolysaccharide/colanic/teichoic acid biosynthesis glycosyltransferase